jgi:hypothetical protein
LGALDDLCKKKDIRRHTLVVAVETEELLKQAIAEAERVLGSFDRRGTVLLLVLPLAQVRGLHKVQPKKQRERLPPALEPHWIVHRDTPVEAVDATLNLQPTIVQL